jgi:hypothetical protein
MNNRKFMVESAKVNKILHDYFKTINTVIEAQNRHLRNRLKRLGIEVEKYDE